MVPAGALERREELPWRAGRAVLDEEAVAEERAEERRSRRCCSSRTELRLGAAGAELRLEDPAAASLREDPALARPLLSCEEPRTLVREPEEPDLRLELDAMLLPNLVLCNTHEAQDVASRRVAVVHDEVGVDG